MNTKVMFFLYFFRMESLQKTLEMQSSLLQDMAKRLALQSQPSTPDTVEAQSQPSTSDTDKAQSQLSTPDTDEADINLPSTHM